MKFSGSTQYGLKSSFSAPFPPTHTHTHTLPSNTHAYSHIYMYAVTGTFLNTLKFTVKDCDPNTGEPDEEVGFDDEYVVRDCYR